MTTFIVYRNGRLDSRPKTFTKSDTVCMNVIWRHFNNYAQKHGFTERLEHTAYLGDLAWKNPRTGEVMELCRATPKDIRYLETPEPEIITTDYQFAHGRMPRGRGTWAFFFGQRSDNPRDAWFSPLLTSWSEAKKLAKAEGKRRGVSLIYLGS